MLGGAKIHPPQNLVARIISFFGVANDRLTGIYRHNALNASPFEIISADGAFFGFCRPIAAQRLSSTILGVYYPPFDSKNIQDYRKEQ